MVQVVGFKVDVFLKGNNNKITGVVTKVVEKNLYLDTDKGIVTIPGHDIKDLKVVDLPKDIKKKKKSEAKNTNYQQQQTVVNNENIAPKKKILKRKETYGDSDATWDANISAIKDNGDFDFEKSTAEFDKVGALEEFAVNDNIDPSERLAGHNKLKTKYDHDENVLTRKNDNWNANNVDTVASKTLNDLIRGDRSSMSAARRSPSLEIRGYQFVCASNPKEQIPLATPIQLLEVERLSAENFKISPTLIAENASKVIASLVIKILGGSSRIHNLNHNLPPLVLLLAGNNRAGSRALATGRQLTNQGVRVIAFTLQDESSLDDEQAVSQLELFKLSGGKHISATLKDLTGYLRTIESPVELIIDALQGYDTNISDLWGDELEIAKSLISWTNNQVHINKISLDIPSGFDAGSGLISDLEPVESKWVISLGLPLNGLLHAYSNGVINKHDWSHYLIDIGIPSKLFKKGSLRKFDRNWFGGDWSVQLDIEER